MYVQSKRKKFLRSLLPSSLFLFFIITNLLLLSCQESTTQGGGDVGRFELPKDNEDGDGTIGGDADDDLIEGEIIEEVQSEGEVELVEDEHESPLPDGDDEFFDLSDDDIDVRDIERDTPSELELDESIEIPERDDAEENDVTQDGFCTAFEDCQGELICNFSLGRCEERSTFVDITSGIYGFHPLRGTAGDLLVIDGKRFFHSMGGNFNVQVWIGTRILGFFDFVAWDENRLIVRVPNGVSGKIGVSCEDMQFIQSQLEFSSAPSGLLACEGETPPPLNRSPNSPTRLGRYAAGYVDINNDGVRIFYPARCGSNRRAAIGGEYPIVAILHGNGAGHVNYEYLGQLLASRGMVVINPPSIHTNEYDEEVIDKIYENLSAIIAKDDLFSLHPALEGIATRDEIAFIGHSRGCGRMQELFGDYPSIESMTRASVFLGPANLNIVVPGHFLAIGATNDGQSFPHHYNGQYDRQPAPKWKVVIQGGNHSLFADAKVYTSFDGVPTISRKRQLTIISSFVIPLIERAFRMEETAPHWLDNPPQSPDYTFESQP